MTASSTLQFANILVSSHMTATVDTESGSRYTVVSRPKVGVVLINDVTGKAMKGQRLLVVGNRMILVKDGQPVWRTTRITAIDILTN